MFVCCFLASDGVALLAPRQNPRIIHPNQGRPRSSTSDSCPPRTTARGSSYPLQLVSAPAGRETKLQTGNRRQMELFKRMLVPHLRPLATMTSLPWTLLPGEMTALIVWPVGILRTMCIRTCRHELYSGADRSSSTIRTYINHRCLKS